MSLFWKLEREIGLQEALECFQKALDSGRCEDLFLISLIIRSFSFLFPVSLPRDLNTSLNCSLSGPLLPYNLN